MCLAVPGKVLAVDGLVATVDFWGVQREVLLHIVDEPVRVGDYILNHAGFAVRRIPTAEIEKTTALFAAILAAGPGDLFASEVQTQADAASKTAGGR